VTSAVVTLITGAFASAATTVTPFTVKPARVSGAIPYSKKNFPFAADGFYRRFPLPKGYTVHEYFVSGRANIYQFTDDGIGVVAPCPPSVTGYRMPSCSGLPYETRMLVYEPKNLATFSGNVWVDPLNPTDGNDYDVVWRRASDSFEHTGNYFAERHDIFVEWTSKSVTVNYLKKWNPTRYKKLHWPHHPFGGAANFLSNAPYDGITFDVAAQIGATLKLNGPGSPIHGLSVQHVFETGFSQDGGFTFDQANYFNRVERLPDGGPVYDGYVPQGNTGSFPINFGLNKAGELPPTAARNKIGDVDVPVLKLNTQSELQGSALLGPITWRRPDSDTPVSRYREWEVAGGSHDDVNTLADPTNYAVFGTPYYVYNCAHTFPPHNSPNLYPYAFVANGAYQAMERWVGLGIAPPHVAPIEQTDLKEPTPASVRIDRFGNALGGVRTPYLEVPIATYHASDQPAAGFCALSGWDTPFSRQKLVHLYPTHQDYVKRFASGAHQLASEGLWTARDAEAAIQGAKAANVP
jgi:hypothetical protein